MEAEFYLELGEGADRLEIPWASPEDPANRYYDLKNQPGLLAAVAEAAQLSALADFLRAVNAPESLFATAKCDTWTTSEFSPGERAGFPAARTKFASYVDLIFARPPFNFDRRHYEQLASRLSQLVAREPVRARAELCLRHCYYHAQQAWGYYLTIFLYGYGAHPAQAQQQWAAGLAALQRALEQISRLLGQALEQQEGGPQA